MRLSSAPACASILTLLVPLAIAAQQPATPNNSKRAITVADIKAWNAVRQATLSDDGQWFAWVTSPNEGNATLHVRRANGQGTETRIPVGENGGTIEISGDSKWIGYIVAPNWVDTAAARGRGAARGAGGGNAARGGGAPADSAPRRAAANKVVLMNLASGE